MPSDVPDRGCSYVHVLAMVFPHAAAAGALADLPAAALGAAHRQLSTVSTWLQHTASGDGQAGPHAQAPAALPAVRRRGGGDERHVIFECPSVQHIRDQNPDLFWDGQSMRELVNQAD